jgi:alpha-glucuronidase
MSSGRTLWGELVARYDTGVDSVDAMTREWKRARPFVDPERRRSVADDLRREQAEARWWRDASIAWWQNVSGLALPRGRTAPAHPLAYYQALKPPHLPGQQP